MTTVLIGHRGTGKTSFLNSLEQWAGARGLPIDCLDLDRELEKRYNATVGDLFAKGEERFREIECSVFQQLLQRASGNTMIALGAGFEGPMPAGVHVVWLRRVSDGAGRSFLQRPRLNTSAQPMTEYRERFFVRDRRYQDWAHEELFLPEGEVDGLEEFFFQNIWRLPWDITLLPENFRDWKTFCDRRKAWQIRHWEIRDDLLSSDQIEQALRDLPQDKILFSRRSPHGILPANVLCDWALELGEPPRQDEIVSLHERGEDFASTLAKTKGQGGMLKLAVEVKDFTELKNGHDWWLEDPARRSFMPRSPNGRWRWYRSLFGPRMPLHFFREGNGSSLDQPFLWQTLLQPPLAKHQHFAAVLGQPIEHSRSPSEHMQFFAQVKIPFVAIDLPEDEFSVAIQFLKTIGLRYAAVTAPLKKLAWAHADSLSAEARQTQSANSLVFAEGKTFAHNTDLLALQQLRRETHSAQLHRVWLWGGGGVKSSVKGAWPEVTEISARQGTDRADSPDLMIWAASRQRRFVWPSPRLRPKLILDLNYSDDSPALEWAVRENLPYQSGLRMFKLQAEQQRAFWQDFTLGERP